MDRIWSAYGMKEYGNAAFFFSFLENQKAKKPKIKIARAVLGLKFEMALRLLILLIYISPGKRSLRVGLSNRPDTVHELVLSVLGH